MSENKFPYTFPFTFKEFIDRWVTCTDIEDSLAFGTIKDSTIFGNIEDTIKFVEVTE